MNCVGIVFSNVVLLLVCGEQPIFLAVRVMQDHFGQLNQMLPNPDIESFIWRQGMSIQGSVSPTILQLNLDTLHIHIYFRKLQLYQISKLPLKCPLILAVSPHINSLTLSFIPSSGLDPPFQPYSHTSIMILILSSMDIYLFIYTSLLNS